MTAFELMALWRESHWHRAAIESAPRVGCFRCERFYPSSEIASWCDGGQTAICPHCDVDAVVPDDGTLSAAALDEMRAYWFDTPTEPTEAAK